MWHMHDLCTLVFATVTTDTTDTTDTIYICIHMTFVVYIWKYVVYLVSVVYMVTVVTVESDALYSYRYHHTTVTGIHSSGEGKVFRILDIYEKRGQMLLSGSVKLCILHKIRINYRIHK
jgi:hypothetical protein